MGEWRASYADDEYLNKIVMSIRDWGSRLLLRARLRQHLRPPLQVELGDLPHGYDHKYTYSHLGYNLKIT